MHILVRTAIGLLVISLCALHSFSQVSTDSLAKRVNSLQELRLNNISSDQRDSVFNLFDSTVAELMKRSDFHNHPVDSNLPYFYNCNQIKNDTNITLAYTFMSFITFCNSNDHKLRVYTWEGLGGGCGHDYRNELVYTNSAGEIQHFPLDTFAQEDAYTWAPWGYYDIQRLVIKRRVFYFLYGFGTSCGSSAYKNLRILEMKEGNLEECYSCYPNGKEISLRANRSHYLHFDVNPKKKSISYRTYAFDEDIGFYKHDEYEDIVLKYKSGFFVKQ